MDSINSSLPSLRFRLRVNFVSCSDVTGGGADVMNSTSPAYAATQADEPASASVTAALMPANLSLLSVRTSMHNTAVPSVRKSDHLSKNDIYLAHSNPKQKTPVLKFAAEESEDEQTKEHSPDPVVFSCGRLYFFFVQRSGTVVGKFFFSREFLIITLVSCRSVRSYGQQREERLSHQLSEVTAETG